MFGNKEKIEREFTKYKNKALLVTIPSGEVKCKFIRQSQRTGDVTVEVTEEFKCYKVGNQVIVPPYDIKIVE